jgi:hypothetical protein
MTRISSNQYYLTTIHISFWMRWLLVCLYLVLIAGCAHAIPAVHFKSDLEIHDDTQLPNILLVRSVVPEVGEEYRERLFSSNYYADVESESRFGDPGEDADLSCIYAGLREALPSIDIIPTATFWEQIEAPQDVIELPELFTAPQFDRVRALQADVLVIAYHARIDVENTKMELVVEGVYANKDKETASIIVVDLNRKSIIHGSRITFEDEYLIYRGLFIVPLWVYTSDPPDICNMVARQAGLAIAETMPDHPVRAMVVLAGEEPMREDFAQQKREKLEAEREENWEKIGAKEKRKAEEKRKHLAILEQEANKGNTDAQLKLFKEIRRQDTNRALGWLCKSADLGNLEARVILAEIHFKVGGHIWINPRNVERNDKLAYVWYALSGKYDQELLQSFADIFLTSEQQLDAEKTLEDWQPGNCERELGLTSSN